MTDMMSAPAETAFAITPSDSALIVETRALYIGTTGNVTVDMVNGGSNITFTAVPVGVLPIRVKRVYSTGTTASTILGLY